MVFISKVAIIYDTARCITFNCNLLLYAYDSTGNDF